MELRILQYFLMVAREENITRAAKQLHMTQPTLSRQLMQLEDELGKTLFIRGKRKIELMRVFYLEEEQKKFYHLLIKQNKRLLKVKKKWLVKL